MGIRPFFEIAATLIPVLLFGGVLVNRPDPTGKEVLKHPIRYLSVPMLAMFAIVSEMFAIRGAVLGEASTIERIFVFGTILLGMASISLGASLPIAEAVRRDYPFLGEKRYGEYFTIGIIVLACGLAVAILWEATDENDRVTDARAVNAHLRALSHCMIAQERAVASHGQKASALAAQLEHVDKSHRGLRRALNQSSSFQIHLSNVALDQETRCNVEFNRVSAEFP